MDQNNQTPNSQTQQPMQAEPVMPPQTSAPASETVQPMNTPTSEAPSQNTNSLSVSPKSSSKGIIIAIVVIILLIVLGSAAFAYLSFNKKTTPPSQQAQIVPTEIPTPTEDPSSKLPLEEQANQVDVGNVTSDLQDIEQDLSGL